MIINALAYNFSDSAKNTLQILQNAG